MTAAMVAQPAALTAKHDAFRRKARDRYDRHEQMMQAAVEQAIGEWLDLARHAALGSITASAPKPKRASVLSQALANAFTLADADATVGRLLRMADRFGPLLDRHVMPVYGRMLDEVLGRGMDHPQIGTDMLAWRARWLDERRQELVKVPDSITGIFRTALGALAQRQGTSVDDAETLAQQVLDRGYPSWAGRARMIARTETVGANNQGSLAAWSSLASASSQPATKTWLATEDDRTRRHHRDMDGKSVPIAEDFTVGGHRMNGPGDNRGPAAETINCRCTLTYEFADPSAAPKVPGLTAALVSTADTKSDSVTLTAAAGDPPTGVAIMLGLGAGTEAAILAGPGVPEPEAPGLHCTVAYLSEPAADYTPEQRAALLAELAKLGADGLVGYADAFATAHFNPESDERDPCAVLLVQSDWLATFRQQVIDAVVAAGLELSTTFPVWIPHVAVAYNAGPEVIPEGVVGTQIEFNRLVVGWAGEQIVAAGDGAQVDPADDTDSGAPALTAAQEAPVTAPPAPLADQEPAVTEPPADGPAGAPDLTPQGRTWQGPIALLDVPSSDGRIISSIGGTIRTLPVPLNWQREYAHGGMEEGGVVMVGRILAAEVRGNVLWASGDWLDPMTNFDSERAMAQVEAGLGLCSVDLAIQAMGFADELGNPIDPALVDEGTAVNQVALEWELGGNTIVSFPAFDGCRITNDPVDPADAPVLETPGMPEQFAAATPEQATISDDGTTITLTDGSTVGVGDRVGIPDYDNDGDQEVGTIAGIDVAAQTVTVTPDVDPDDTEPDPDQTFPVTDLVPAGSPVEGKADELGTGQALTAASAVRPYTRAFFNKRDLHEPTPLTVVPETGEVYGHLATWGECHTGKLQEGVCVTAPHSLRDYGDFHLSPVMTDDGPLDIGRITVGTGHAMPGGGFANAVAHYDNTGTAVAVVRAYEDDFGVQLTGQLVHDTPAERVEELMRSPLSGDWRMRNDNLELCAALAVNVPGFPVRRPTPVVGQTPKLGQLSLVAAGVVDKPARKVDGREVIGLPSGATIMRGDFEALVAAAADTLQRQHQQPTEDTEAQALALARARLRLLSV